MMKGGIAGLMKQTQQMQKNMKKAQEQLAQVEVEGQSGFFSLIFFFDFLILTSA